MTLDQPYRSTSAQAEQKQDFKQPAKHWHGRNIQQELLVWKITIQQLRKLLYSHRALHHTDLGDGEIQSHVDNHSEEQDVKGSNHQERLLQHQDFVESVMNLQEKFQTLSSAPCYCRVNSSAVQQVFIS